MKNAQKRIYKTYSFSDRGLTKRHAPLHIVVVIGSYTCAADMRLWFFSPVEMYPSLLTASLARWISRYSSTFTSPTRNQSRKQIKKKRSALPLCVRKRLNRHEMRVELTSSNTSRRTLTHSRMRVARGIRFENATQQFALALFVNLDKPEPKESTESRTYLSIVIVFTREQ